ncbi:hypothetical protein FACS1894184_19110 [Clostridia bacterium]|nr:hypothetical protein FACS1894184_19110 [Clostridia bacterium]
MLNESLLSVIIPVYNVGDYLSECIDSVLHNSYEKLEVILVDDGSTDSSGSICDEYKNKDSRIKVIHQVNSGCSYAKNAGFSASSGEYVYFLDSDDFIRTDMFEACMEKAKQNGADIVFFDGAIFKNGSIVEGGNNFSRQRSYNEDTGRNMYKMLRKYGEFSCCCWLLFIKRDIITENRLCFFGGKHDDVSYAFLVFNFARKACQIQEKFIYHRIRTDSIMTSHVSIANFLSCYDQLLYILDAYSLTKNILYVDLLSILTRCCLNNYWLLSKEERLFILPKYVNLWSITKEKRFYSNMNVVMYCYFPHMYKTTKHILYTARVILNRRHALQKQTKCDKE